MTANAVPGIRAGPNGDPPASIDLDGVLEALAAAQAGGGIELIVPPHAVNDALLVALGDRAERLAVTALNRAVAASAALVTVADAVGGPAARVRVRRAAAHSLAYAGRFPEALERCAEGIVIATKAGELIEGARARLASIHALASLGRFDEAIAAGEIARQILIEANQPRLAARADLNLGAVHAMRDDPRRALLHFDRARDQLAGDPAVLATLETNRGNALTALDDFAGAEAAFAAAVTAFEAQGQALAAAIAEGNLAHLAARQGRLPVALYHFERARRLLEREPAPAHLARLQAEQALTLATLGLRADALAIFERVLPNLEAQGLTVEAAQARAALGAVYRRLGLAVEAGEVLSEAAGAFAELGQPAARGRVLREQAELAAATGDAPAAIRMAEDALALLADRPAELVGTQALLARLALAAGDQARAERALATAFPLAEQLALAPVLAELHLARGRLHRSEGKLDRARTSFRAAVAEVERVRGALQAERFRTAYLANRLAAYEELVVSALDAGDDGVDEAFAVVERAKSRSLFDVLSRAIDAAGTGPDGDGAPSTPRDPSEESLVAEAGRLRAELNWRYSRLAETGSDSAAIGEEWGTSLRVLEADLDAVQTRLAAAQAPTGIYAPTVGTAEIRAILPSGAALLEYFVAGDEVLAFLVRPDAPHAPSVFRRLATPAQVVDRIRRFRFQIRRALAGGRDGQRIERLAGDARRALDALAILLVDPLGPALEGLERLVVVPHGPLHAVPFHALPLDGRYLIERVEVAQVPSASVLTRLAGRRSPGAADRRSVVVGCPDDLTPGIPEEVERVAATLGNAHVILGSDATAAQATRAIARAGIAHVACHGRYSPDLPASSGLKLADRWLTLREVTALRLDGAHVTLSGCDTGRADVTGGDELIGLARAFLAAGASSVLVSLWPVHDDSTVDLMADLYGRRRLAAGETIGAALRQAQLAALVRQPHPAVWAPFVFGGTPWT